MNRTDPSVLGNPTPKDVYMNLEEKLAPVSDNAARVPAAPTTEGDYWLKCSVDSEGAATYSWSALPE